MRFLKALSSANTDKKNKRIIGSPQWVCGNALQKKLGDKILFALYHHKLLSKVPCNVWTMYEYERAYFVVTGKLLPGCSWAGERLGPVTYLQGFKSRSFSHLLTVHSLTLIDISNICTSTVEWWRFLKLADTINRSSPLSSFCGQILISWCYHLSPDIFYTLIGCNFDLDGLFEYLKIL